jgi:hypothetical protein
VWWDKFRAKKLKYTRGYLLELLYSDNILIYNVTFKDSPSWNLHPTYCTYVSDSNSDVAPQHILYNSKRIIRWGNHTYLPLFCTAMLPSAASPFWRRFIPQTLTALIQVHHFAFGKH